MTVSIFDPNGIIAGDHPIEHLAVTIVSGAGVLTRGTVLGKITSGGKYKKSLTAAEDGSQTPVGILAVDVDATSADVVAPVFFEGTFASEKLVYGASHDIDTVNAAFRAAAAPLYVKSIGAVA